ncbi:MAG: carbohydrate-binding family 9-like protein [Acidimicrobiia bacterium]|nr:carbohydrate-binding family 9-like protein [Acidimicrobiia bacterium]
MTTSGERGATNDSNTDLRLAAEYSGLTGGSGTRYDRVRPSRNIRGSDVNDPNATDASVLAIGPHPDGGRFPRWTLRADVPDRPLPQIPEYSCLRAPISLELDGNVDEKPWPWSAPFVHIGTGDAVSHLSRVALLWNEEHLYAAFDFIDPDREATATEPGTHVYEVDTAAELLTAGPTGYHEIGVNSIGTSYEVDWRWVAPLVEHADYEEIDRLYRLPNYLYYAPRSGERAGRVGDLDFRLSGLVHAEAWSDRVGGIGWTVEMALPWSSLDEILGFGEPVRSGRALRVQAMRARPTPEGSGRTECWTWSVQGNANVHNPERWTSVTLVDEVATS